LYHDNATVQNAQCVSVVLDSWIDSVAVVSDTCTSQVE